MSLLNDLMNKIQAIAETENVEHVTKVKLKLGALAHISSDHLREHFEEAAVNTVAENANLEIITSDDTHAPDAQDIVLLSVDVI